MTGSDAFRPTEQMRTAVEALASDLGTRGYGEMPAAVRERLPITLTDLLGVTVVGMRTPELRDLMASWPSEPGPHPVPGADVSTTATHAALLSAVAACSQELDEGNKYAAGHPAAHVVFAAIAAAQEAPGPVSGERFLAAVAAGYEVAARFGRALQRRPEWHTHGHWGVTGAACAASIVGGASPEEVAAAIDASCGLMTVTPWSTVLAGDFTRNLWMAQANLAGLTTAHLARAGLVSNRGGAASSLALVGDVDAASLTADLGDRWLVTEGYLKQHSACSYTHAAVDIVQALRATSDWSAEDVDGVYVGTHSLARPLLQRDPDTRLAAMFSLPFVVSTAVVSGAVTPSLMEPGTAAFEHAQELSTRVRVEVVDELDAWLPDRRVTEVRIELKDGSTIALSQPNPIGDTAHFPLSEDDVVTKIDTLLGVSGGASTSAAELLSAVRGLAAADDVVAALADLPLVRG